MFPDLEILLAMTGTFERLDVPGVLKVQRPTFDRGYAARWADETEVADLLARAYEDAGYPA